MSTPPPPSSSLPSLLPPQQLTPPPSEERSNSPAPSEASTRVSSFSSAHYIHHHGHSARLPNPPTFVEWSGMRFLIMDAPCDSNLDLYLREFRKHRVTDLVRVCDPTYARETVERQGIRLHEMLFPDGDSPPESIISSWMGLVEETFDREDGSDGTIAVHCVAGLGRAPVLVAVALIEAGMSPLDAISFLRERRRGAINNKQLRFLESYRRRNRSVSPKCSMM